MRDCMKNPYALSLSVGIIALIGTMVLSMASDLVFPAIKAEYETPAFRPWDDPVMSLFFLYPVILGMLLTSVWLKTRKAWKSGLEFGLYFGALLGAPAFVVNFSSFTFSLAMVGAWAIMGFLNALLAGIALEKLSK